MEKTYIRNQRMQIPPKTMREYTIGLDKTNHNKSIVRIYKILLNIYIYVLHKMLTIMNMLNLADIQLKELLN